MHMKCFMELLRAPSFPCLEECLCNQMSVLLRHIHTLASIGRNNVPFRRDESRPRPRPRRYHGRPDRENIKSHSVAESVFIPPGLGPQAIGAVDDSLSASEPHGRHQPPRRNDTQRAWVGTQDQNIPTPMIDSIFEHGPRSRGFPYALRHPPVTLSAQNPTQADGNPGQFVSPDLDI